MKERGIPMSAPNIQPIREDRKTHTRRLVSRLNGFGQITEFGRSGTPDYDWTFRNKRLLWNDIRHARLLECCPYGQLGDRLWVRETWAARGKHTDSYPPSEIAGNRSHFEIWYEADCIRNGRELFNTDFLGKWRPSIFMPRNLSRILLEITDVRVERLQEISEKDAWAEGCEGFDDDVTGGKSGYTEYAELWEFINGEGSWDLNPYVWVIAFKRIEG